MNTRGLISLLLLSASTSLVKDPASGLFTLTVGLQASTNLMDFSPFPMTAPQTTINGQGELEFQFSGQDDGTFFRLQSR